MCGVVRLLLLLALLVPLGPAPARADGASCAGETTAASMIGCFHEQLTDRAAGGAGLTFAARRERLAPAIETAFASDAMARLASGRAWRDIGVDDRARIIELFTAFTVANYTACLAGEVPSFEVVGERPDRGARMIVEARVVAADGDTTELAYVVGRHEGRWQTLDVLGRGRFSELARRRAEFTSILERRGIQGLIETLETRIAALAW